MGLHKSKKMTWHHPSLNVLILPQIWYESLKWFSDATQAAEHAEGALQLHPPWSHPCVPPSEHLQDSPAPPRQRYRKYFPGCSRRLRVCILTIKPCCRERMSSSEQPELFLYITRLLLIFFCLISNHFWQILSSALSTRHSVTGMLRAQPGCMQMLG